MSSDEDADKSIEKFSQYELERRALTVNEGRPREDRGRGGGGGGYRHDEPRW